MPLFLVGFITAAGAWVAANLGWISAASIAIPGVGLLGKLLKHWRVVLAIGGVLSVLVAYGVGHYKGKHAERASWENRLALQIVRLTKQYKKAKDNAELRAAQTEKRMSDREQEVKGILAEMARHKPKPGAPTDADCSIPASVTDRLRKLR